MTKDEIIKALRDMARYPTVTLPRDSEALKVAADLLAQPEQELVAFPRQAGDSTWTVDTAFIWRVKHTIDPDTPHDFIPSEEQIETVLLALERIPSGIYTTPPQRGPLTDEEINDIAKNYALNNPTTPLHFARAIEAAHGIKE